MVTWRGRTCPLSAAQLGWLWWVLKWLFYLYVVLCIMIVPENCFVPTSMLKKQEQFQEFLEARLPRGAPVSCIAMHARIPVMGRIAHGVDELNCTTRLPRHRAVRRASQPLRAASYGTISRNV